MGDDPNRGDLEYGYHSFERGTKFGPETSCLYLDVLNYDDSNGTVVQSSNGHLNDSSLEDWLFKDITRHGAGSEGTSETIAGGLRLLLGQCDFDSENSYRLLPFTEEKFNIITEHFQLPSQFIPSMITTLSRSFKFLCSPSPACIFKPTTCFVYKVALFGDGQYHLSTTYSPKQNLTYALLLFKPRYDVPSPFSAITQTLTNNPSLASHPLFLPILIAELSVESSAPRIRSAAQRLDELEGAAGQHEWVDLTVGDPLNLDFAEATKQLNFASRWLNMEIWRCKANLLVLENIKMEIDVLPRPEAGDEKARDLNKEGTGLKELIAYHANTCHNLIHRAEFEEKRLQTQIAVVYQFMVQKDSKVNLSLAETTTIIAKESKKDSSAMKAIAVLTMCFLPGTFLAALFAMPFFNWDHGDLPVVKEGFKYYCAIAVPLTLLVLGIWAVSMLAPWRKWVSGFKIKKNGDDIEANGGERMKGE